MTHIGKNIRKIRGVKKLSQQAFADLFGLSRANIGSYEEGRAEPKIGIVMDIANKFSLDVEAILNKELKVNEISNFNAKIDNAKDTLETVNLDLEARLIPFVSFKNRSTYLNNLESQEYLNLLPRFEIPFFQFKSARAFETEGNELVDRGVGIKSGDILIGVKADAKKISTLKEGCVYVIIANGELLIRKLLFGLGALEFYADNQFYAPKQFYPSDITEMWEAHTLISSQGGTLNNNIPKLGVGDRGLE